MPEGPAGLKDGKFKSAFQEKVRRISAESESEFKKISQIVESEMS
jgi:hypothetical protein